MVSPARLRPVRVQAPAALPISVDEAKAFLKIDGTEEDWLVADLIASAVDHLDGRSGVLGRCMVTQVWRYSLDNLMRWNSLDMPGAVLAEVSYIDVDGVSQLLPAADLELREETRGSCLVYHGLIPRTRNFSRPVTVDVTFGTEPDAVPAALKQAIRLLVAHWHLNREAVGDGRAAQIPFGFATMIAPYRWHSI